MKSFKSLARKHARSYKYAFRGLSSIFANQLNFKIEFIIAIFVIVLSVMLDITRIEWVVIMFSIFLVLICEALNTAIEAISDALIKDFHEEIKYAKDVGAGAVLLAAVGSVIAGLVVFTPYISEIVN